MSVLGVCYIRRHDCENDIWIQVGGCGTSLKNGWRNALVLFVRPSWNDYVASKGFSIEPFLGFQ